MTTPHKVPPLALTLRGYAAIAPSLMRPHLAAAADAVEELSKLRAERDEARDCIGFNAYRALESERDRISELHAASQAEIDRLRAELTNEREVAADVETDYGQEMDALRAERDAALADATALAERCDNLAEDTETELKAAYAERDALQARVDALMREYCPDEMTTEQRATWAAHQQPVAPNVQAAADATLKDAK